VNFAARITARALRAMDAEFLDGNWPAK